jgi:glycosyltransferase involved in cell wall biosynthesis
MFAVSVIIPVYDPAYLIETLDSVFAQTFTDCEVIVVNDGSPDTDRLEQALDPYLHRIVYIKQD